MGSGRGSGLDFGRTRGSREKEEVALPDRIKSQSFKIGKSTSAAAKNYSVKDPATGRAYKFIEGTTIEDVEVFAGKGVRKKLNPDTAAGLVKQVGGKARDWKHVKGVGRLDYKGRSRKAEVHWFEASGVGKVKFKVKEWLE